MRDTPSPKRGSSRWANPLSPTSSECNLPHQTGIAHAYIYEVRGGRCCTVPSELTIASSQFALRNRYSGKGLEIALTSEDHAVDIQLSGSALRVYAVCPITTRSMAFSWTRFMMSSLVELLESLRVTTQFNYKRHNWTRENVRDGNGEHWRQQLVRKMRRNSNVAVSYTR